MVWQIGVLLVGIGFLVLSLFASFILLNMRFERKLIPLSSTLTESTAFSASFLLLAVMMAAYRVAPTTALVRAGSSFVGNAPEEIT